MKLETAYLAKNLVTALEQLLHEEKLLKQHHRHTENETDDSLGMEITYDYTRGVEDLATFQLDYHESCQFFQFLRDVNKKRRENTEFEIGRLGEMTIPSINVLYKSYLDAQGDGMAKPFAGVTLRDVLDLHPAIGMADEVWLLEGVAATLPRLLKEHNPDMDTVKPLTVIRMSYGQYCALVRPEHQVHIDDMRLKDLPISENEKAAADEIWITQGSHERALKKR